ncbi:penicillin-binding protein, partial [Bacillus inaquosorum]|nr:penicillin-binding protein [Bacillus inaquosorum]
MTSPTRRRTAKRRRRKLNKRGKLLLGLLAVMICFTIWNALHRNGEENEPSQETAA